MSDALEQWLRDHCYDPDDIVFGDQGLTERQLPALHALLDIVAPGWREVFGE
jgi:hypothetical protein